MGNTIKKIISVLLTCMCLAITPALGQDALDFYNRGLKSSLTYKKIEYFTKALHDSTIAIRLQGDKRSIAKAYATRAGIYQQMGFSELSEADFRKSIELYPAPWAH